MRSSLLPLVAGVAGLGLVAAGCATACPVIGPGDLSGFDGFAPAAYRLQPGDVLRIDVWQNEALSRVVRIRPDGQLSLPNLGEVAAAGATVPELSKQLVDALKVYLPDPLVTISVERWMPIEIYILGAVRRPDAYSVLTAQRLLPAVARAGGTTPGAARCAVVLRRAEGRTLRRVVDLDTLSRGQSGQTDDVLLRSGDIVTVY